MDVLTKATQGPVDAAQAADLALELFVVGYEGDSVPADYADMLRRGLSGAILFRRNFDYDAAGTVDLDQVCAHTQAIHACAAQQPSGLPVVCSVDQEGGAVARLKAPFSLWPPMRRLGERGDVDLITQVGHQLGRELHAAGFNVDYAPILDVDTNPNNPIIGDRSFSRDPHEVARMAGALLRGMQAEGVLGCGKHFPGHGDTDVDSHLDLPVLPHDLQRLQAIELVPFTALAPQLQLVMTAHVLFPAIDPDWPATLAPQILGPLLRVACGYRGVIVSDDLEMQGIAKVLGSGACVRRGLQAGVDLFLVCKRRDTLEQAWRAATSILQEDPDSAVRARALDAIGRNRAMRQQLRPCSPDASKLRTVLADAQTARLRERVWAGTLG